MWLKEELERKFSSHWWMTDCTKYVQNKTKQEQVPVLCCSGLISNPDREHEYISYTLINLNMLFNFFIIPNQFLKSYSLWLEIYSTVFCGGEWCLRLGYFQSETLFNMKKGDWFWISVYKATCTSSILDSWDRLVGRHPY